MLLFQASPRISLHSRSETPIGRAYFSPEKIYAWNEAPSQPGFDFQARERMRYVREDDTRQPENSSVAPKLRYRPRL